jgi:hypothetical protein
MNRCTKNLKVANPPIITVVAKAFWDINHVPKDQSNCRRHMPGYAVWENETTLPTYDIFSYFGRFERSNTCHLTNR